MFGIIRTIFLDVGDHNTITFYVWPLATYSVLFCLYAGIN